MTYVPPGSSGCAGPPGHRGCRGRSGHRTSCLSAWYKRAALGPGAKVQKKKSPSHETVRKRKPENHPEQRYCGANRIGTALHSDPVTRRNRSRSHATISPSIPHCSRTIDSTAAFGLSVAGPAAAAVFLPLVFLPTLPSLSRSHPA
jgi:hypothetical protein